MKTNLVRRLPAVDDAGGSSKVPILEARRHRDRCPSGPRITGIAGRCPLYAMLDLNSFGTHLVKDEVFGGAPVRGLADSIEPSMKSLRHAAYPVRSKGFTRRELNAPQVVMTNYKLAAHNHVFREAAGEGTVREPCAAPDASPRTHVAEFSRAGVTS